MNCSHYVITDRVESGESANLLISKSQRANIGNVSVFVIDKGAFSLPLSERRAEEVTRENATTNKKILLDEVYELWVRALNLKL